MSALIEEALRHTTDTRACVIGPHAVDAVADMFRDLFPGRNRALIVCDPRTRALAAERAASVLRTADVSCSEYVMGRDGKPFHAVYELVDEVREALASDPDAVPVAVGSGTINDTVKRASEELGRRYLVVGTAASMDGYTSYGASITKDGIKQTLACKAPLGCIVDSAVAAGAPRAMTASGYADLIAKIPAGADWMLADAIASESIHPLAWRLVQEPLRDSLARPEACAAGDEREVRKLCEGLVMSGFAMQAMGSSRPASGTEHQVSHYWDMEDLSFEGSFVSHGFKVGVGTLASTAALEYLLAYDFASCDVAARVAAWYPSYDALTATYPAVFGNRPLHIRRALDEMKGKFPSRTALRDELETLKAKWPSLLPRLRAQIMPFADVKAALAAVGAPFEPEMIGVTRARFRETLLGVPYMRNRYFGLDLIERLGLMRPFLDSLFGAGGVWAISAERP